MNEAALKYMLDKERAGALSIMAERLEKALAALRAFDAAHPTPGEAQREERATLVSEAGKRLYSYVVTREASGISHHDEAISFYKVPREVVNRMGVV